MVLGMLAITLAVSYALMRAQVQTSLLQNNSQTNVLARQAAEAGLMRAIRKMSIEGEWEGVGTTMTGNVDSQSSYSVTYTAGDASLLPADPNYSQYPYRVTVISTGTALNGGDATLPTTYTVSAVLQLVRRALNTSAKPSRWDEMNAFTCYQWNASGSANNVDMDLPIQIQGDACLMGKLKFAQNYPPYTNPRQQYLQDLKLMKDETGLDYRPFTGNVALGAGRQDAATAGELTSWLGLSVTSPAPIAGTPWGYINAPETYQLYAGGPTYTVGNIASTYGTSPTGTVITPSVLTNPLGVFHTGNDVTFGAGTKFTGVLFANGGRDLTLNGANTELNGVSMTLDGASSTIQVPVFMGSDQLIVANSTVSSVNGLAICWGSFVISSGSKNTVFQMQGRLFSDILNLSTRTEWSNLNSSDWTTQYNLFGVQKILPVGVKYFPQWMDVSLYQLNMKPKIVFQPPTNTSYHWPNWGQPIYTKAAGDAGLRWNIVSWKDGL